MSGNGLCLRLEDSRDVRGERFFTRRGEKRPNAHRGKVRKDVVAEAVEVLLAREAVGRLGELFECRQAPLAGGTRKHEVVVREVNDEAFAATRQGKRLLVGGQEPALDRVDPRDEGRRADPTDDKCFARGRTGVIVRCGLRDDDAGGQTPLHRFGKAQDVVFARLRQGLLDARGAVGLPREDPGLVKVVQQLPAHGGVVIEVAVKTES